MDLSGLVASVMQKGAQVSGEEREILLAAQEKAIRILSEASSKAARVASEAEREAVALVLAQQESAERLLHQARQAADEGARPAEEATALLESHRTAAELLSATEQDVAAKLDATSANAAVDCLMAGHRKAAAVLLDAWMRVTEGRPADGERAR